MVRKLITAAFSSQNKPLLLQSENVFVFFFFSFEDQHAFSSIMAFNILSLFISILFIVYSIAGELKQDRIKLNVLLTIQ